MDAIPNPTPAPAPLAILSHVPHPAVTTGFLAAAQRLGRPVVMLTDHRLQHLEHFEGQPPPWLEQIVECDVFNPLAVLDALRGLPVRPAAVFSNSDHLQAQTAAVANALGLPGKDWRVCYAAKNKAAMRERLRDLGLPSPWFHDWLPEQPLPDTVPYPVIAKPREGVASLDVQRCECAQELEAYARSFRSRYPGRPLLLEEYLQGPLFTLETLGDGRRVQAMGGFDVRLSAPPHFVELEALWNGPVATAQRQQALAQVLAFGVHFGVCHSEFVLTGRGPVLVEINYRSIGDGREFMLDRLLHGRWFEQILRLHLGEPLQDGAAPVRQACVRYYPAAQDGRLLHASSDRSHALPGAHATYRSLRKAGEEIRLSRSNKDYLGSLAVVADSAAALESAFARIEPQLQWDIAPAAADRTEAGA